MKRSNGWWIAYSMLVPAMLGGFLAGWQNAFATVCTVCECKDVNAWWANGMVIGSGQTSRVVGKSGYINTAIQDIGALGTCKASPPAKNGQFDRWDHMDCNNLCDILVNPSFRWVYCNDKGTLANTFDRFECK